MESTSVSPKVRQALLILVPLRLARDAQERGEVEWYREVVDACLFGLGCQLVSPRIIVRQLFFQLLQLLLADPAHRESAHQQYTRLGLELAEMRRTDGSLPYNPVVAYDRYCAGREAFDGKLASEDHTSLAWFLERITLEQVANRMSLP